MNKIDACVILAAGLGTRMKEVTKEIPKPLVKVNGESFIERIIDRLIVSNIKNIYIVVGYKAEQFNYLKEKYKEVKLIYNEEYEKRNNISSLYHVKDLIKDKHCIICEADLLIKDYVFDNCIDKSYYLGYYSIDRINDWGYKLKDNRIIKIEKSHDNDYNMIGISYWTSDDINVVLDELINDYYIDGNDQLFWDEIVDKVLEKIDLNVNVIEKDQIIEIDTFKELCDIDSYYMKYNE